MAVGILDTLSVMELNIVESDKASVSLVLILSTVFLVDEEANLINFEEI
jgi:hypothetical protein